METPTTVKIEGNNDWMSRVLAAKFLQLGYDVVIDYVPSEHLLGHRFLRTDTNNNYHSQFIVFSRGVTVITKDHKVHVFLIDPNDVPCTANEICEFIIGTWGTIRGDRCKFENTIINVTRETMNDWRVI
jgi:hypothetical protein